MKKTGQNYVNGIIRTGTVAVLIVLIFACNSSQAGSSGTISSEDSVRRAHWTEDLQFLKNKFETEHYDLFRKITKAEWESDFSRLLNRIPKLKDHEVITEAMKIIVKVGDGHSSIQPAFKGKHHFHQLPLSFHDFADGVFIKGAAKEYEHLVGSELMSIGGVKMAEVKKRLKQITNRDNEQWIRVLGVEVYMTLPEMLYSIGLTKSVERVEMEVKRKGVITNEIVEAGLFDIAAARFLDVQPDWVSARANDMESSPLYLKHIARFPDDFYWFEHLKKQNALYFQMNVTFDKPNESLKAFFDRMFQYIESEKVENLIVDIRLNSGGNNQLIEPLISKIEANSSINRKGNLFVIVGRRTFSAAMNLSTRLEQRTNAIFVGEATGSSPNFVGEDNLFALPYSGIMASASNRYWQDAAPDDTRPWIQPQYSTRLTFKDYVSNHDPDMTKIRQLLSKK